MSQVSQDVRRARFSDRGRCVAVGLTALMMVASSESGCSVGGGVSGGSLVPVLGGFFWVGVCGELLVGLVGGCGCVR